MAMIEQNISGVKLEKLRQKAVKKNKVLKNAEGRFCCLFACHVKTKKYRTFFDFDQWGRSGFWDHRHWNHHDFRRILLAFCIAAAAMGFYLLLSWKKTYNEFNDNYKVKFYLKIIREF